MAFIPVPKAIKVDLEFVIQGREVHVTFGVGVAGSSVTNTDMTNAVNVPAAWWVSDMKPHFSNQTGNDKVTAYDLTSSSAPVNVLPVSPAVYGTTTGAPVPSQVAIVTSMRTPNRGRSFRGREYWPGFAQGQMVDDRLVDTTFTTALQAAMNALDTQLGAANLTLGVISRFASHAPRAAGILTPTNGFVVNQLVDTQRRRSY